MPFFLHNFGHKMAWLRFPEEQHFGTDQLCMHSEVCSPLEKQRKHLSFCIIIQTVDYWEIMFLILLKLTRKEASDIYLQRADCIVVYLLKVCLAYDLRD